MKQTLLNEESFTNPPYTHDIGDEGESVWHESGRAARWIEEEGDIWGLSLFYGSDPWVELFRGEVQTEEEVLAIIKEWCDLEKLPSKDPRKNKFRY